MIKLPKINTINYYYVLVVLIYFLAIYFPFIRVGLFMSLIMLFGVFILYKKKIRLRKGLDMLVLAYISYNIVSVIFYYFSDIPVSVFFKEFSNSILPIILFYFFGRLDYDHSFYKITLYAFVVCFIVGFYFQLTLPLIYMQRMHVMEGAGTNPLGYVTMYRSFLGITATGALGAIGLLLSFNTLYKSNFKTGKFFFVICFIAVILSFRRAALYTGAFGIISINMLVLFKFKGKKTKLLFIQGLIGFLCFYWLVLKNPDILFDLGDRFMSLSGAIDERIDSWFDGLSKTQSLLTGDGLGRYGHKVVAFSDTYIPDGNYFRMIAELGIVGFLLFLSIIFTAIYNGLLKINTHYIQLLIVIMVCMQSVGSDMFSFQLVAPIFWYSIGACSKFKPQEEKK
jgi:hypothetical protein